MSGTTVILGGGAWGAALACAFAAARQPVTLVARDPARFAAAHGDVRADVVASDAADAELAAADVVVIAIPAQALRGALERHAVRLRPRTCVLVAAKGVERGSLKLMHEVVAEVAPHVAPALLSGPSFAADVARALPTAVTIAAADAATAAALAARYASAAFRLYHTTDLAGVALGGAAKNVYAIAAGVVAGRGLGRSAEAALIARSFAELARLGAALGARTETLMGLSGLGDLVLTATSAQSRNYAYGLALGAGAAPPDRLAEGALTAEALVALAKRHGVETPIASAVDDVVAGRADVAAAISALLARPLTAEA